MYNSFFACELWLILTIFWLWKQRPPESCVKPPKVRHTKSNEFPESSENQLLNSNVTKVIILELLVQYSKKDHFSNIYLSKNQQKMNTGWKYEAQRGQNK